MSGRLSWPLTLGFGVSVLLHAGGALTVLTAGAGVERGLPSPAAPFFEPAPIDEEDVVDIGSLTSEAMTMVWLGYDEDPVEHRAEQSIAEQAALDPGSSSPESPVEVVEVEVESDASAEVMADAPPAPDATEPVEVTEPAEPVETIAEASVDVEETAPVTVAPEPAPLAAGPVGDMGPPLPESGEPTAPLALAPGELLLRHPGERPPLREGMEPAIASSTTASEIEPAPAPAGGGAPASSTPDRGNQADREALATAIEKAVDYRPGRPLVNQGVEVKTVRPRFAKFTRLSARPENLVVRLRFTGAGIVESHEILRSTGEPDVDRSTLDALYQWTAKGPAIEALKAPATFEFDVRILFRE